ncbi:hypothetical protein PLICRDRAFT_382871 [Plicaturopsis crispa FD-325 SS-3]|nr:hypothetical protein PLICRDRAFT_382871 [Plicaturopsis crispa FD-325 SS-3]
MFSAGRTRCQGQRTRRKGGTVRMPSLLRVPLICLISFVLCSVASRLQCTCIDNRDSSARPFPARAWCRAPTLAISIAQTPAAHPISTTHPPPTVYRPPFVISSSPYPSRVCARPYPRICTTTSSHLAPAA